MRQLEGTVLLSHLDTLYSYPDWKIDELKSWRGHESIRQFGRYVCQLWTNYSVSPESNETTSTSEGMLH